MSKEDQVGWVVLFIGTPFMDGRYTDKKRAVQVKDRMKDRYPNLRFEVAQVGEKFLVSDDIFWANHYEELDLLSSGRTYSA